MILYTLLGKWVSGIPSQSRRFSTTVKISRTAGLKLFVTECRDLILWGTILQSSVGKGRFSKIENNMIKLPPYQYSILVGLILSDGWLTIGSSTSKNARFGFKQSLARSDHVWWVFNLLSHYCSSYPQLTTGIRSGKPFYGLQFFSRSLTCFTELHSLFYVDKVKIIPQNIYELLTPIALAHLIMGDGGFKSQGIYICTDSYSIQDVVRLMNVLILRYDLKCTLHKASNKHGYRIYISRNSLDKVKEIVKPYFIPSMVYKLGE